jgi:preprotein translocase subunit Sss1
MISGLRRITPERAAELFVVANLAFLGLDILLAHQENGFARRAEWAPVVFSAVATVLLLPTAFGRRAAVWRTTDRIVAVGAIVVGVTGMVLHLKSAFFEDQTLGNLVYSAPFLAPLAYVGVGLLLLLVRIEPPGSPDFGAWVVLLALGGFVGNFGMALLDHAQNGLFHWTEWIPVWSAAFGASFLLVVLVRRDASFIRMTYGVLALQAAVGLLGFVLHVTADLARHALPFGKRFVFGAPAFAPLLFDDLAVLAALGLWALSRTDVGSRSDDGDDPCDVAILGRRVRETPSVDG